jgi:hypothetical protein
MVEFLGFGGGDGENGVPQRDPNENDRQKSGDRQSQKQDPNSPVQEKLQ